MRRVSWMIVASLVALSMAMMGCDSGDSETTGTNGSSASGADEASSANGETGETSTETTETDNTDDTSTVVAEVPVDCGFSDTMSGKGIGDHIGNLTVKTWDQQKHEMHYDCGGGVKVLWVFLSTGWCGACENYAGTVQDMYAEYKDKGLRVLWLVGEDQAHENPSWEYMEQYHEKKVLEKGVEFTIARDAGFSQTYVYFDFPGTGSLPHHYLLDGETMELLVNSGGTQNDAIVAKIQEMLD